MNFNFEFSTTGGRNQPMGVGGKLFASVICLVFFVGGVFIAWMLGRQIVESLRTRRWQSTTCTIVRRSIPEKPPYAATLEYSYQFNGKAYKSNVISKGYRGGDDYYDAQKILDAFPKGPAVCRVNPADPAAAVLQTPSLWIVFEILFPLPFIAVGGGLFYLIWWTKLTSNSNAPGNSKKVLVIACSAFFVAGVAMLCAAVPMYQRHHSAQSWAATPCTIVHSSVASHDSSSENGSSTTYSVEVLFRYTFDKTHRASSRYSLASVSSSGYDEKKQIVDQLNSQRKQTCYVNPLDPADAVLERNGSVPLIILSVMGSIFSLLGAGGLTTAVRGAKKQRRDKLNEAVPSAQRGPANLHPDVPRAAELIAMSAMCLFWNGATSVFVVSAIEGWINHHGDIGLTAFVVPFVLAGLGIMIAVIAKARVLFLPAVQLSLSRSPLEIGEQAELRWQITGDAAKIRRLTLRSVVFEVSTDATAAVGLKKVDPIWSQELIDANRRGDIQSGRRMLTATEPVQAKEPFKRIWAIQVKYDLGKSKPLIEVFPMRVLGP